MWRWVVGVKGGLQIFVGSISLLFLLLKSRKAGVKQKAYEIKVIYTHLFSPMHTLQIKLKEYIMYVTLLRSISYGVVYRIAVCFEK